MSQNDRAQQSEEVELRPDFSEPPSSGRKPQVHGLGWTFAILAALTMLYLLSVPAVLRIAKIKVHPADVQYHPRPQQSWAKQFCKPYAWLMESGPLHKPLDMYATLYGPKHQPLWKRHYENRKKAEAALAKARVALEHARKLMREYEEKRRNRLPFPPPSGSPPSAPARGKSPPLHRRELILPPSGYSPKVA